MIKLVHPIVKNGSNSTIIVQIGHNVWFVDDAIYWFRIIDQFHWIQLAHWFFCASSFRSINITQMNRLITNKFIIQIIYLPKKPVFDQFILIWRVHPIFQIVLIPPRLFKADVMSDLLTMLYIWFGLDLLFSELLINFIEFNLHIDFSLLRHFVL